jgi:hypothetical protein
MEVEHSMMDMVLNAGLNLTLPGTVTVCATGALGETEGEINTK